MSIESSTMQFLLSTILDKKRYVNKRKVGFNGDMYLVESTCSSIICSHGSKCRIDDNGLPQCYCPDNCNEYAPSISSSEGRVCGTDNQTYESFCELNRRACQIRANLTVAYFGECRMLTFFFPSQIEKNFSPQNRKLSRW